MTLEPTPLRPDEQVAGGYLHVTLGGQDFVLPVLPIRANREWIAKLREQMVAVLKVTPDLDTIDDFVGLLAGNSEAMMDLLLAYDAIGAEFSKRSAVLPERDWIDTHATDRECYEGMKRVTAAAYPFGPDLLRMIPEIRPLLLEAVQRGTAKAMVAITSSRRMSSVQQSTVGRPTTSKATSPMSSSRSTSTRRRRAAGKKPSVT